MLLIRRRAPIQAFGLWLRRIKLRSSRTTITTPTTTTTTTITRTTIMQRQSRVMSRTTVLHTSRGNNSTSTGRRRRQRRQWHRSMRPRELPRWWKAQRTLSSGREMRTKSSREQDFLRHTPGQTHHRKFAAQQTTRNRAPTRHRGNQLRELPRACRGQQIRMMMCFSCRGDRLRCCHRCQFRSHIGSRCCTARGVCQRPVLEESCRCRMRGGRRVLKRNYHHAPADRSIRRQ